MPRIIDWVEFDRFDEEGAAERLRAFLEGEGIAARVVASLKGRACHVVYVPLPDLEEALRLFEGESSLEEGEKEEPPPAWGGLVALFLLNIAFLVWVEAAGGPHSDVMRFFGAVQPSLLRQGEYYRLVLAIFLHFGFRHFIANMLTLLALGPIVVRVLGTGRFLLIYVVSGIVGNLLSFLVRPDVESVRAGASGAVLGLIGALVGARMKVRHLFPSRFKRWHIVAAGAVLYAWIAGTGHADHIAHLGGALGGFLMALLLPLPSSSDREGERRRSFWFTGMATAIFTIALAWRILAR